MANPNPFLRSPTDDLADELNAQAAQPVTLPEVPKPAPMPKAEPPAAASTPQPDAPQKQARAPRWLPNAELMPIFESAARQYNVPINVGLALAHQESRYNPNAVGQQTQWGRAKGMLQYLDDTAAGLGINPFDPSQAIPAAFKQIRERLDKGYSMEDAVKEHFAGPDRKKWGAKTEAYGREVMEKVGAIGNALGFEPIEAASTTETSHAAQVDLQQLQKDLDGDEQGRYQVLPPDYANTHFSPALMDRAAYEQTFRQNNPGASPAAVEYAMGEFDKQAAQRAAVPTVENRFKTLQDPAAMFDQRLNEKLAGRGNGIVPALPDLQAATAQPTPQPQPTFDAAKAEEESALSAGASYLGRSLQSGLYDLAGAGAKILDEINPWTLSPGDAAVLFKDDPAKLKQFQDESAAMVLSRFATSMSKNSEEAQAAISDRAKRDYGGLEYATLDQEKAAYRSPVKVIGDAVRSLPTTVAMAVSVYLTRGAALQAEKQALAAGLGEEAARRAAVEAGAKVMSGAGAVTEGATGYAQQANQSAYEASKLSMADMAKSPKFQQLVREGFSPEAARAKIIADTGEQAGQIAGIVDAAVNKVGGEFLGKVLTEGGKLIPRIMKGAANEAATETVQSAGEKIGENRAVQQNINPNQNLMQGVGEAAAAGAAVGGLMGGVAAGAGGRGPVAQPTAQPGAQPAAQPTATPTQVAPVPAAAAPAPKSSTPLSASLEGAAEQPQRVIATTPDGQVAAGTVQEYREDGDGNFIAKIVGDDGQVYTITDEDGVQLTPVEPPAGPLTASLETAADQHAAEQVPAEPQAASGVPVATEEVAPSEPVATAEPVAPVEAAPEPAAPFVPSEPPAPTAPADMSDDQLRTRMKYLAGQFKGAVDRGVQKKIALERRAIEAEINARAKAAATTEDTNAPIDAEAMAGAGAAAGRGRGAGAAGRDRANESGGLVPDGGVGRGGRDAAAAVPANGEQGAADVSAAAPAADAQPALTDTHAGQPFASDSKARAYIAKNRIGATHYVKRVKPGEFEIRRRPGAGATMDTAADKIAKQEEAVRKAAESLAARAAAKSLRDADAKGLQLPADAVMPNSETAADLTHGEPGSQHSDGIVNTPGKGGKPLSADSNTTPTNSPINTVVTGAELGRDVGGTNSLLSEGDSAVNVEGRARMLQTVLSAIKDNKVFRSVISAIPVDVMNDLIGPKLTAKNVRGNKAMFVKALTANYDLPVGRRAMEAIVRSSTINIAEVPGVDAFAGNAGAASEANNSVHGSDKLNSEVAASTGNESVPRKNRKKHQTVANPTNEGEQNGIDQRTEQQPNGAEKAPGRKKTKQASAKPQASEAGVLTDEQVSDFAQRTGNTEDNVRRIAEFQAAQGNKDLPAYFEGQVRLKAENEARSASEKAELSRLTGQIIVRGDRAYQLTQISSDKRLREKSSVKPVYEFTTQGTDLWEHYIGHPDSPYVKGLMGKAGQPLESAKPKNAAAEKPKPVPSEGPAAEQAAPAAPIGDFGEKIHGARKDVWTGFRESMSEALPTDVKDITLAKHFPEPNYAALIDAGVEPKVLAAFKAMRDSIPAKPRLPYKAKRWGEQVAVLRGFANQLIDGSLTMDKLLQELRTGTTPLRSFAERIEMYAGLGYPLFTKAKDYSLEQHHYTMFNGESPPGGVTKWELERAGRRSAYFDTQEEGIEALRKGLENAEDKATGKKVDLDLYRVTSSGDIVIGKKVAPGKFIDLKTGFKDVREARKYLAEHRDELLELLEKKKDVRPERRGVNEPRVGIDRRKGTDITPDTFGSTFGFRGVQFGNYVEQKRRAADLNNAYDALLDLADTIGVPPRALSLNGKLGLAFGARGKGGKNPAAAHYEPGQTVINLTKTAGAGSLAHEWWHGLDNYFAKMRNGNSFITQYPRQKMVPNAERKMVPDESIRAETLDAFKGVVDAIRSSGMLKRSRELDGRRSKDYWSTIEELTARAFESYVIDKAAEKGYSNDYLANILSEPAHNAMNGMTGMEEPFPYPLRSEAPAINAAFDKLFETLETRDQDGKVALYSVTGEDAATAIQRLMQDKAGEATINVPGVGEVTITYGDSKSGLAHIARRRGENFLSRVVDLLQQGKVYEKDGQKGRIFLGHGADEAVLSLDRDGKAGTWLLSAYEKYPDLKAARLSEVAEERMPEGEFFTKEDLRKSLTSQGILGQVIASMIDAGVVKLHGGPGKLPGKAKNVKGVQAVTMPDGTIHLVASNLTPRTAFPVMMHEMFHQGGEKLIGTKEWGNLMGRLGSLYRQSEQSSGKAREFYDRARARVAAAKKKGAVGKAMEVEEFAAYAIEEYEKSPDSLPAAIRKWVEDLIGVVKTWLVKNYGKQLGQVTPAQLAAMARWAVMDVAAERRGEIFGPMGEMFSTDSQVDTENADTRYSVADDTRAEPVALTPPEQGRLRSIQAGVQDSMNRVKEVQNRITKLAGRTIGEKADYYLAETNRPGRIAARLEDAQNHLFQPLMKRLAKSGFTQEQLSSLLHAEHAHERNEAVARINPEMPDGGSGMTNDEADAIIKLHENDTELHAIAQQARDIARATLDLKLAYGLLKQDDYDMLASMYENYVPLKGDGEYGPKIKRAMGHEERDEHILENIARDYQQGVVVGEKNLARQSLLRLVLQNPDPDLWTVGVPPKGRYVAGKVYAIFKGAEKVASFTSKAQVQAFLEDRGANAGYTVRDSAGEQVQEFAKPLQDNEVMVYVKGDPVRIQIGDEKLARQLRPIIENRDLTRWFVEKMRALNRFKAAIYTGRNPAFIPRNMARDAMTGTINMTGHHGAQAAAKAWGRYPKAFAAMMQYAASGKVPAGEIGGYLTEYRQHGGKVGASHMSDLEQQGKTLTRMFDDAYGAGGFLRDGRAGKAAWVGSRKLIGGLAHGIEVVNQAAENALRLSLYATLREQGSTPAKAAQAAKTVTVDFDRKGEATGVLGALYLFINPAIQGTANMVRTMATGEHKVQAWTLVGALAAAGYLTAGANMDDDKERWLGEEWDARTKNYIRYIGNRKISIPLSQEYSPFYAAGAALAEGQRGESAMKSSVRLFSSFLDAYFPLQGAFHPDSDNHAADLAMATVPTAIRPHVESAFNRNSFGSQIVPENELTKSRPDNLKMNRGTKGTVYDKAAQGIASAGELLGAGKYDNDITKVSPETLKHLWRTYTGGLGQFITDSAGMAALMGEDLSQVESSDVPIVKDFVKPQDVKPLRGRYYDLAKEAKSAQEEFRQAKKAGDAEAMDKILGDERKAELLSLAKTVTTTNKAAAELADEKVDVLADDSLSTAKKREKLKDIEKEEEALYRDAIDAFK